MNRIARVSTLIVILVALLAAIPAAAQPAIYAGLDTWYTPQGGAVITLAIPAGYFCGGSSAPQTRTITLKGSPIASSPSLAPSDTVIERSATAPFINEVATTNLKIVGLSLVQNSPLSVNCGGYTQLWNVRVGLSGPQASGTIAITRTHPNGGTFNAYFPVNAQVWFTNVANGRVKGPLSDNQTVSTVGACWSHTPGPGSVVVSGPVSLDSDKNGSLDYTTPLGTGPNFWPIDCGGGGGTEHEGPHPTTCAAPGPDCPEDPPNPCPEPWIHRYLHASAIADVGFIFSREPDSDNDETPIPTESSPVSNGKLLLNKMVIDICTRTVGARYLK